MIHVKMFRVAVVLVGMILFSLFNVSGAYLILAQETKKEGYLWIKKPSRYALIIGNSNYKYLNPIESAESDADSMAERLREMNFDSVMIHKNVQTLREFEEVLEDFRRVIHEGDLVMFYFSGHGFSFSGVNFLVPSEMPTTPEEKRLFKEAYAIASIEDYLSKYSPGLLVMFLDACRSPITVKRDKTKKDTSEVTKGFVPPQNRNPATTNSFIGFSAKAGSLSFGSSKPGELSPYTLYLQKYLPEVGMEFFDMYRNVIWDVRNHTHEDQIPGVHIWSVTNPILNPDQSDLEDEEEAWRSALNTKSYIIINKYADMHSISLHAAAARKWLADNRDKRLESEWTFYPPVSVERAWEYKVANPNANVAVRRSVGSVAYPRAILDEANWFRLWTNADLIEKAEADTVGISDRQWKESAAASFTAHGQVIVREEMIGYQYPELSAMVIQSTGEGAVLNIKEMFVNEQEEIWALASPVNSMTQSYYKVNLNTETPYRNLGNPLKEIRVESRENSLEVLVAEGPIREALNELRDSDYEITWISLSVNDANDQRENNIREARLSNARYILEQEGIEHTRITSVVNKDPALNENGGVRLRFFGYLK